MRFAISRVLLLGLPVLMILLSIAFRIWTSDMRWVAGPPLDAAIILGAAAPSGSPSPVFAGRLDFGERLFRSGAVRFVIVTGGGRDDPTQPEAAAGAKYLLGKGLPANRVLFETSSKTTPENLCFAAKVGAAHGLRSYAIVSDPLHLPRAMQYASDLRLQAKPAATPYTRYVSLRSRLPFLVRETYLYTRRMLTTGIQCPR